MARYRDVDQQMAGLDIEDDENQEFTFEGEVEEDVNKYELCLVTGQWWQKFPLCKLKVIHTISSDHDPILLELFNTAFCHKQFRFRFENTWLKEDEFHDEVTNFWRSLPPSHILPKLLSVSGFMAKWGKNFSHKFRDKVKRQKAVLNSLVNCVDEGSVRKYWEERKKLNDLMLHEEIYWKQRAKTFWLVDGDSNTKFFHALASKRKKINHISSFKLDDGSMVMNHEEMCDIAKQYYEKVFAEDSRSGVDNTLRVEGVIDSNQNNALTVDLTLEEFTVVINQIHPDKAAGPDGLNSAFFQHFWSMLGKEVFSCCKQWLDEVLFPEALFETTIVLILKKENAESMSDYRPIALCNVLYKILAKVLANRLKKIIQGLISENQSAFVPGRSITDNVLIAYEILHHMKRKCSEKKMQ